MSPPPTRSAAIDGTRPAAPFPAPPDPSAELVPARGAQGTTPATGQRQTGRPAEWADTLAVAALLGIAIAVIYGQLRHFDFLTYDDPNYVTDNPLVVHGLTLRGLRFAFTTAHAGYWHPLTWLSHMLDVELFGLDAGAHHLTSVLLHAINSVLLYRLVRSMTGAHWKSAFVAAIFAVHPLHVESVAWIAERKDVLSTTLGLGAMWAYVGYARRGGWRRYGLCATLFAASLLAKPMLVTLPLLLLLLDYWPLGRLRSGLAESSRRPSGVFWRTAAGLLVEKVPLLALSALSVAATLKSVGVWFAREHLVFGAVPFGDRLPTAVVAPVAYLGKTLWPTDLAVLYPHPALAGGHPYPLWQVLGAASLLVAVTVAVLRAHHRPYLAVGWLWYLGSLVPVVGLVQVGAQSMADRYTYVSMIGLSLLVTWGARDLLEATLRPPRLRRWVARAPAVAALAACTVAAHTQTGTWRNSIVLYQHAIAVTGPNVNMRLALGMALADAGRFDESAEQLRAALVIKPDEAGAHGELGRALAATGHWRAALKHFTLATELTPDDPNAHYNLGIALLGCGRPTDAIPALQRAVELRSDDARIWLELGRALLAADQLAAAGQALSLAAALAEAHQQHDLGASARAALPGARRRDRATPSPAGPLND